MSQPNSITLWLRPAGAIKPYIITECAKWLVKRGDFKKYEYARKYLGELEKTNPILFKSYIASYHKVHDYDRSRQPTNKDINQLYSSTDPYGSKSQCWTKSDKLI